MREIEMTAKTVEEAVEAACRALGVDRDDLGVSYEVLEFPTRRLFKTIPAKVKVTVEEPEAPAAEPAAPAPAEPAAPARPETPAEAAAPAEEAETTGEAEPAEAAEMAGETVALDIAADPQLQAAVEYLTPIFTLLGARNFTFSAARQGEATVLRIEGEHLGGLIGRRGETMESLSYLASLVVNRLEGPYVKLGLDVGGYRRKREEDLQALAARIAARVQRTGCCYEMEPMNPYERHIIHTAISAIEGVRSESKGEGNDRRVVIYSTDPDASNLPDRESAGRRGRGPRRGDRRRDDRRGGRGPRRDDRRRGDRRGYGKGPRPSGVPGREFADAPRDPEARPQAPARTQRIHDDEDDFAMFGKIEL
ncbi:RNA-binding cell elongation regulator Jag/EloR [uncultured Subdoligranulum sp.]|uniref:RNA-binding cell elongation regulator Jag/EloR n=1 Tax=uncultured Subdoligranulum sp. TaxID=512298 RepID=UPI0025E66C95|nr:RNA-binding cell elongation regulator Jag/EloR [uncultured Subdoligranulum sp.]